MAPKMSPRTVNLLLFIFLVSGVMVAHATKNSNALRTPKPPQNGGKSTDNSTSPSSRTPPCTTIHDGPRNLTISGRNGVTNPNLRWTRFNIQLDPTFEQWERDAIDTAMWNLSQIIPCVRFGTYSPDARPTGDYMRLIKGTNNGCNSIVGKLGGRQDINLQSPGCINVGTITHEFLHALGFHHEHNRHDRDDYVQINWDNIQPEFRNAFDRKSSRDTTTFGIRYDYNSIMHYESKAFSRNNLSTIVARNGQSVGTRGELQPSDIRKLKAMYNC